MSNKKGLTEQDIIDLIIKTKNKWEVHTIYFVLKQMRLRYIKKTMIEQVRVCLALNELGLPITSYFLSVGLEGKINVEKSWRRAGSLHNLGDRHVLTLVRDRKAGTTYGLRWVLNPEFIDRLEGKKENAET